jgi:hypothetical protein
VEKARSREEDQRRLDHGEITPAALQQENRFFGGVRLRLTKVAGKMLNHGGCPMSKTEVKACVTGDTLIATAQGFERADELDGTQKIVEADGHLYTSTNLGDSPAEFSAEQLLSTALAIYGQHLPHCVILSMGKQSGEYLFSAQHSYCSCGLSNAIRRKQFLPLLRNLAAFTEKCLQEQEWEDTLPPKLIVLYERIPGVIPTQKRFLATDGQGLWMEHASSEGALAALLEARPALQGLPIRHIKVQPTMDF